jgi:hypothetical protein
MAGLLLAYNAARFGDPLDFGQRYQLSTSPEAARRAAEVGLVSAWAVLVNVQLYLLAVPTLDVVYPFLAPYASVFLTAADPPLGLVFPPGGWLVAPTLFEAPMVSVFLLAPIGLFAVGAFRGSSDPATRMLTAALVGGLALTFTALVLYPAVQVRYTGDIVPALALLGGIGALRWAERRPMGLWSRRWSSRWPSARPWAFTCGHGPIPSERPS